MTTGREVAKVPGCGTQGSNGEEEEAGVPGCGIQGTGRVVVAEVPG